MTNTRISQPSLLFITFSLVIATLGCRTAEDVDPNNFATDNIPDLVGTIESIRDGKPNSFMLVVDPSRSQYKNIDRITIHAFAPHGKPYAKNEVVAIWLQVYNTEPTDSIRHHRFMESDPMQVHSDRVKRLSE